MDRRQFLALTLLAPALPAAADWRRDNEEACGRIDRTLKDIETERRRGYTPKQGRKLQAQREKLEQKRREQCR